MIEIVKIHSDFFLFHWILAAFLLEIKSQTKNDLTHETSSFVQRSMSTTRQLFLISFLPCTMMETNCPLAASARQALKCRRVENLIGKSANSYHEIELWVAPLVSHQLPFPQLIGRATEISEKSASIIFNYNNCRLMKTALQFMLEGRREWEETKHNLLPLMLLRNYILLNMAQAFRRRFESFNLLQNDSVYGRAQKTRFFFRLIHGMRKTVADVED